MLCNKNVGMVNALQKQHPKKFKVETRPAKDHADELKKLQIDSHGVVCERDGKLLWKHGNHKLSQAKLDEGVGAVLAALK